MAFTHNRRPLAEEEKSTDAAKARARAMELLAGQELSSGILYERLNRRFTEQTSAAVVAEMVERGMGLSFLPEYIVRDALAAGRVARLNVPDCTVTMRRQLFYHKDKWLTPQMKAFMELAQQSPVEGTC